MSVKLNVSKREGFGRGYGRKLRDKGFIPAVVYGKESGEIPIEVDLKDLKEILASEKGKNALIDLTVEGSNEKHTVMVRDLQKDPIKGEFIHMDLHQISLDDKVHTQVPIVLVGEPIGVKKGGILQYGLRELDIQCLATDIPEQLEIDITELDFGEHISLEQIETNRNIRVLTDKEAIIASIVAPRLEVVEDIEVVAGVAE